MQTYKITDIKKFMSLLLTSPLFDNFALVEATIKKYTTISIDGRANKEFYKNAEDPVTSDSEFAQWAKLRHLCTELIKGKNTPLYMKFVLQMPPESLNSQTYPVNLSEAHSLILNITFSEQGLNLTTAVNFIGFYPDSNLPALWDDCIERLLNSNNVKYDLN